jgi:hypothetical protein
MKKPIQYLICRQVDKSQWTVVSNPNWTMGTERLGWAILENLSNKYVEYENCGVIYRIVRSLKGYEMADD